MASINWTDPALLALDGIHDHLNCEAPFYATHIVQQLIDSAGRLEEHPLSGRKVPEAERDDIREVLCHQVRRPSAGHLCSKLCSRYRPRNGAVRKFSILGA
jgi:plasmid stabilization system protein ParE